MIASPCDYWATENDGVRVKQIITVYHYVLYGSSFMVYINEGNMFTSYVLVHTNTISPGFGLLGLFILSIINHSHMFIHWTWTDTYGLSNYNIIVRIVFLSHHWSGFCYFPHFLRNAFFDWWYDTAFQMLDELEYKII